ncbi:hypothetical protein GGC63_005016 [Paenibacillus sp. OAS669]|nr:hypothetical protein [Paenibacillus sp. OAS669]
MSFLLFVILFSAGCGWLDSRARSTQRKEGM